MKIVKPHFWYNKSQRNGVFLLLILILVLQVVVVVVGKSNHEEPIDSDALRYFESQIDSLRKLETEARSPKSYSFNPNYISDYKGGQLGMSLEEIDRLLDFRKQHKFIRSAKHFQKVTLVSDSLLLEISPYFKFPDWLVKQGRSSKSFTPVNAPYSKRISSSNINRATPQDLQSIDGVNEFLANRIISYRSKIKGFSFKSQMLEVWNLKEETALRIFQVFSIIEKPVIAKVNVNTASFKELLSNPYINYELCKKIFAFRDEVAELQSVEELKQIDGFPLDKYDRIVLYLKAN